VLRHESFEELEARTYFFSELDEERRKELLAEVTEVAPDIVERNTDTVISRCSVHVNPDSTRTFLTVYNVPSNLEKVERVVEGLVESIPTAEDKPITVR